MRTSAVKTFLCAAFLGVIAVVGLFPGEVMAQTSSSVAPTVIPISGQFPGRTGTAVLQVSLYDGKDDSAPRWIESHTVTLNEQGGYTVQFGSASDQTALQSLFVNAPGARWLGVAFENEPEAPNSRVMLVSVPYAAKAGSAESLGGRTAADFMLTSTFRDDLRTVLQEEGVTSESNSSNSVGTAATTGFIPKYIDNAGTTDNSQIFESGGNIGIGTTSPVSKVHIMAADIPTINLYSNSALRISSSDALAANKGGSFSLGAVVGSDGQAGFAAIKGAKENGVANNYDGYLMFTTTKHAIGSREAMRITSDGNIGIGTSTPVSKLHVVGPDVGTSSLYFGSSLRIASSDAMGADKGGSFSLGGSVGSVQSGFAAIKGAKENAIPDNYDGYLMFTTTKNGIGSREAMRITADGNIGLGTSLPLTKLHIVGNVTVDGNIGAKYQDVAEWVDAAEPIVAGSVVIIDNKGRNRVTAATRAYDSGVAGAVSHQPGLILGEPGEGRVLVAQSGRVRVKADARFGAIRPGDLVVTSPTKGHVMRSRPIKVGSQAMHRPGTIVGKALEGIATGQGEILVLLTLQ